MKKYFLVFLLLLLIGCSNKASGTINYVEAKEKIINNGAILLDVRTEDEYNEKHLGGAISIPLDSIENEVANIISDKDKTIIVYCKSGVRSHEAYELLISLGYKDVYDFGSMDNWKE